MEARLRYMVVGANPLPHARPQGHGHKKVMLLYCIHELSETFGWAELNPKK